MGELINGRTPEEIKHVAEWNCYSCGGLECDDCSYLDACTVENRDRAVPDALALIEHLETERDAALEKVPKWISVEERLPWMNQKVLVSDGFIVVEAHYNGRGEWIHNGHCMETGGVHVTHWLLKPEPPMEKERDVGA